jgi:hypothetical protein
VVEFYFCSYFHNTKNIRFSQRGLEVELYDIKIMTEIINYSREGNNIVKKLFRELVQLDKKKTGHESSPNVNLVLSICQLIVYLTIPIM